MTPRRLVLVAGLVAVLSACGGTTTESGATGDTVEVASPSLSGVSFDVRRDPG